MRASAMRAASGVVLLPLAMLASVNDRANAAAASTPAPHVVTTETTSDKPVPSDGSPSVNDDWVLLSDNTVAWEDNRCASTMARLVAVQTVPWAQIGDMPRSAVTYSCAQLQAMVQPVSSSSAPKATPPTTARTATEVLLAPDHVGSGTDAWVRLSDGTSEWAAPGCRQSLISSGEPFTVVPWSSIAAIPTAQNAPSCTSLVPVTPVPLGLPDASGSTLVLTSDKVATWSSSGLSDGWLFSPDGSSQWISSDCVSTLELTQSIKTVVAPWATISALPVPATPQNCGSILPAALPLQVVGTGTITPTAGGVVSSPDGVVLTVPAGAVTAASPAEITLLTNNVYNVHIDNPWTGSVQVTIPLSPDGDSVLHQLDHVFVPETAAVGATSVTITTNSLSPLGSLKKLATKLAGKAVDKAISTVESKVLGPYCLSSLNPKDILTCLVAKGVNSVDGSFADWLARVGGDPTLAGCNQELINTAILNWKNAGKGSLQLLKDLFTGACVGTAGDNGATTCPNGDLPPSCTVPASTGGGTITTPTPVATSNPVVSQPSATQPPAAVRGFTVDDYFLRGTWARTDPGNGSWYSRGNRPANGAYFYNNGLGVGVDCARSAAGYVVHFANGSTQTWTWWLHVTDGKWIPAAAVNEINNDGPSGLAGC